LHQWYWSYEYSDFITDSGESIDFDSYMLPVDRSGKSISWAQLSNSGDTLKIIVPSHNGNVMSGQNNYPGTVTSYDMNESEMGYRGSKSEIN
jgi:Cytochrome C oxidase subunit II, periplasmic domain